MIPLCKTQKAVDQLESGKLLIIPTETVYGIAALASHENAIRQIYALKNRPQKNPLIFHIGCESQVEKLAIEIPKYVYKLIKTFWPGPLSIGLKKDPKVSSVATAGLDTICIRMPSHPTSLKLLQNLNQAIVAPSANISGRPSTTRLEDIQFQFSDSKEDLLILDGPPPKKGLESTILACWEDTPTLLRPGVITQEEIEIVLGQKINNHTDQSKINSPGQILKHYQPLTALAIIETPKNKRLDLLINRVKSFLQPSSDNSCSIGFWKNISHDLTTTKLEELSKNYNIKLYCLNPQQGTWNEYAENIYHFLNWSDQQKVSQIFLEFPLMHHPLREVLKNRLEKASGNQLN